MESNQSRVMKISWVAADSVATDPTLDVDKIKNIGPIWGGWKTWRSCSTDNVICHRVDDARLLISKNFHIRCNMYIPEINYQELDRPSGVKLYHGEFHLDIDHPDEIVAMHLASANSDIVLLLGYDLTEKKYNDKLSQHKWHVYKNYVRQLIIGTPQVQWVLLDCNGQIDKIFEKIENLQFDTMQNILS